MASSSTQKLAVVLAFLAAALSFAAVIAAYAARREIAVMPLVGGMLMLVLAVGGYLKLTGAGKP